MDRKELMDAIRKGPLRIRMNDGSEYLIDGLETAVVSDIAAHVLYRDEQDNKYRAVILPLVTMAAVHPLEAGA